MSTGRAVLKSITNRDYRKQVECLLDEGWIATRTGKNHFRLSHPDAHRDVITSGTPSDHRATENLRHQCRRALRPCADDSTPEVPFAVLQMPPAIEKARSNRKPRWNEFDRQKQKSRMEKALEAPAQRLPLVSDMAKFPIKAAKPDLANVNENIHKALLADAETGKSAPKDQNVNSETAKNEIEHRDTDPMTTATQLIEPARPAAPSLTLVPEVQMPAPASGPAPSLPVLSADLLSVAMRIMSGDLRGITITADMVGKMLVTGTETWIVDGALPASHNQPSPRPVAAPAVVPAAVSGDGSVTIRAFVEDEPLMLALREAMETFRGSWLPLTDIMALIPKPEDATDRGHKENIRRRLNHMVATGHIQRKQDGATARAPMLYCAKG